MTDRLIYHRLIYHGFRVDAPATSAPYKEVLDCVPIGWHPMVARLVEDSFDAGWDGRLHQIKEKFGGLRFYVGETSDEVADLISVAESDSERTCDICGEFGKSVCQRGWLATRCVKHENSKYVFDIKTRTYELVE
jgi:hypothetical protein